MHKHRFIWLKRPIFALFAAACLIIYLQQFTSLDFYIENIYFDVPTHTFAWKNTWFANDLMHGYVKAAIEIIGLSIIGSCLIDLIHPIQKLNPLLRARLRFVSLSAILVPTLIAFIKSHSSSYCPWDVEQYGGHYPHLKLFESLPALLKDGHCFPAGHASTGLWLAAFCIFWLPHAPRKAFLAFSLGIGLGFAMGWVQQMRGAHFLSHTLWSMWIASVVIYSLIILFNPFLETYNDKITRGGQCINY